MSANLAVINFAVGGTLTVSGNITLSNPISSISSANFYGLSTTTLAVSGNSTFNGALPTSTQTPTNNIQLTTKVYVDTQITNTDSTRKSYIDIADNSLNLLIVSTDATRKSYVDVADNSLNLLIASTDAARKIYVDNSFNSLYTHFTTLFNTPVSGQVLQQVYYGSQNSVLIGSVPNSGYIAYNPSQTSPITQHSDGSRTYNFTWMPVFSTSITPKSSNSTLFMTFGCDYQAAGQNGVCVIGSMIMVNGISYGYNVAQNYNVGAFPLHAAFSNISGSKATLPLLVQIGTADTVDPYTIYINFHCWSFTVSEVQN